MTKYYFKSTLSGLVTCVISDSRYKAIKEAQAYFGTNLVQRVLQQAPTKIHNRTALILIDYYKLTIMDRV